MTAAEHSATQVNAWFRQALGLGQGDTPFPWQEELLARFVKGTIDRSLDIPTGLGKTSVMGIWLVARARAAPLPRRLIYVVDRRAVVDQATEVAVLLRQLVDQDASLKEALGLPEDRSLPISTLRGQHVDNREWLEDPAFPAIIVGTVDMIGSRLLFEGYGTTRKMRPYQAGLLGADALVVLDESHLVPPFEELLDAIAGNADLFGPSEEDRRRLVPAFKLLALSATGRASHGASLTLGSEDLEHPEVAKRLGAVKRLSVLKMGDGEKLPEVLAEQAWRLREEGTRAQRCIVFCDKRNDAEAVKASLEKRAKGDKKKGVAAVAVDIELFVGGRRVMEREEAAARLEELGFLAGVSKVPERPAFLVATSAAEVGVDLDADHMVCDLVAWERMVQRLGRVNRRGKGEASVIVIRGPKPKPTKAQKEALEVDEASRTEKQAKAVATHAAAVDLWESLARPFRHLPKNEDGTYDASPGALRELKLRTSEDDELAKILDAATTPAPLRPALSRALVDAWSMTSLTHHTGRPEVQPWLRGWVDDPPQTAVVWRRHLPVRAKGRRVTDKEIKAFFEAAPPHASERLETETFRVIQWLVDRAEKVSAAPKAGAAATSSADGEGAESAALRSGDVVAVLLTGAGDLRQVLKLEDLAPPFPKPRSTEQKKANDDWKNKLHRSLAGATVIVDRRLAGLRSGLLDPSCAELPRTADDGEPWMPAPREDGGIAPPPVVRFRIRKVEAGQSTGADSQWRERFRLAVEEPEDGEAARWLVVEKWRHDAATEDDRSAGRPQRLDEHETWAEERARALAERLGLPDDYREMLAVAARLHDEGKRARRWQRAFNAPDDAVYAKTRGPVNTALLDGYRHELGSLPFAAKDTRLLELPPELQDLALHLIAAHHGFARPVISVTGCEDAPPSALEERAREIALRFARLQKRWGPWGLAWWEALLRAADQQASRDNDAADTPEAGETA